MERENKSLLNKIKNIFDAPASHQSRKVFADRSLSRNKSHFTFVEDKLQKNTANILK